MSFCFGIFRACKSKPGKPNTNSMDGQDFVDRCIFCDIVRGGTSTNIIFSDDKVVAFPDINPSAFRHYLVIPVEHVPTVYNLERTPEHYELVPRDSRTGPKEFNQASGGLTVDL